MEAKWLFYWRKSFFHWRDDKDIALCGWSNINWRSLLEIIIYHLGAFCVFFVGVSWVAFCSFLITDLLRGFVVTILLHRYFSHKCFETTRGWQFIFGLLALTPLQRGPLWWASHHRRHHRFADQAGDPHAPKQGIFYSHLGWLMTLNDTATDKSYIKDLIRYPELIWLDRFEWAMSLIMGLVTYSYGALLNYYFPNLGTNGWQMMVWLMFIPTVLVLHGSSIVNSCLHSVGYRRFKTPDNSRNVLMLSIFTLGEAFHNNHHRYQESCNQGMRWWEIDVSFYMIKIMEKLGIIYNLRFFPESIIEEGKYILQKKEEERICD